MSESSVQPGQGDGGGQGGNGKNGSVRRPNVRRSNYTLVGTVVLSIIVIGMALGISRPEWQQYFSFGFTTREINFPGNYFVLENASKVKIGGVEVGRIDSVERREDGTATYTVRVQPDVIDKVGSAPAANLRPVSLLGGIEYVDLVPGGDRTQPWNDAIPIERTKLPVELGQVLQSLQPDAVEGIPASINGLQGGLENGGADGLKRLAREAPSALEPGGRVLNALTGTNPGTDLPNVVSGFQKTSAVLARRDGQIESILRDLRKTSSAFAQSSKPTQTALRKLPGTLDTAKAGLARLSGTLDELKATAPEARPAVQELDKLLERLDPVLVKARPVVNDLRYALKETRPLVQDLVPAAKDLRYTFKTLDPSLDRVRGPVVDALESGFDPVDSEYNEATGISTIGGVTPGSNQPPDPTVSKTEYTRSEGRRHTDIDPASDPQPTLKEELGQFVRRGNAVSGYYDKNGSGIAFNVGFGPGSVNNPLGGITFEQFQQLILGQILNPGSSPLSAGAGAAGPLRLPVPSPAGLLNNPAAAQTPGAPSRAPANAPVAPALPGTGLLTGGAR